MTNRYELLAAIEERETQEDNANNLITEMGKNIQPFSGYSIENMNIFLAKPIDINPQNEIQIKTMLKSLKEKLNEKCTLWFRMLGGSFTLSTLCLIGSILCITIGGKVTAPISIPLMVAVLLCYLLPAISNTLGYHRYYRESKEFTDRIKIQNHKVTLEPIAKKAKVKEDIPEVKNENSHKITSIVNYA